MEKPSYAKCGPQRIADTLFMTNVSERELQRIREAKRAYKQELKSTKKTPTAKPTIDPTFEAQFKLMAEQLGYTKPESTPASTSKITAESNPFLAKKQAHIAQTPPLHKQVGMHILIGCNHVPFHNVELHNGLINLLKDYKSQVKGFHLMGDFLDLNALSSHDKGKFTAVPGLTLDQEYKAGNVLLDEFDAVLPKKAWKTYLYGNHEDRWNRWMKQHDNSKTPLASPTDALDLVNRNYQVKNSWSQDYFTIGKHLDILHGIYFSIHCAKAHMDKLRGSCAFVHTHRIQQYIEGNMGSFNIGAGADFSSPAFNYATRPMKASWQNGFAIVMVDEDGSYHLTQIICQEGRFFFGGKKY